MTFEEEYPSIKEWCSPPVKRIISTYCLDKQKVKDAIDEAKQKYPYNKSIYDIIEKKLGLDEK